jgi:hypothetical protein
MRKRSIALRLIFPQVCVLAAVFIGGSSNNAMAFGFGRGWDRRHGCACHRNAADPSSGAASPGLDRELNPDRTVRPSLAAARLAVESPAV